MNIAATTQIAYMILVDIILAYLVFEAALSLLAVPLQELNNTPWLKRMPCLIIGRHPQAPREVCVVCKQITGSLLLGNVREELRIRPNTPHNPSVLSPSEFEAAAGCSKGKNWKVCAVLFAASLYSPAWEPSSWVVGRGGGRRPGGGSV